MARGDLQVQRDGHVLRVTINRPNKQNPLSRAVLEQLHHSFEDAARDQDLSVVVLRGAGERYFSSGADLRELGKVRGAREIQAFAQEARAALDSIRRCPVPVVAAINGDALGAGAELAVAADFRVMREGAHIGYIHGELQINSAWGGGPDLVDLVGAPRALRMMTRCERVPAALALTWGLADEIAESGALDAAVAAFVEPMLRLTPAALRACKEQTVAKRRGAGPDERRAIEHRNFVASWVSDAHWREAERGAAARRRAGDGDPASASAARTGEDAGAARAPRPALKPVPSSRS